MKYYMAPMEGVTGVWYRALYHEYYGDADRYFTPFLVGKKLSAREKAEVSLENNAGMSLVPQILTNRADEFVYIANHLKSDYGYEEVNLNLGCPSGTVASKNRGSGFLRVPDELNAFLDYIYTHSDTRISLKTRIGVDDSTNWENILDMYLQYPVSELIVHPRTTRQGYGGMPDLEAFAVAYDKIGAHNQSHEPISLCYNGNVNSVADRDRILARFPQIDAIMCGRGMIQNPTLLHKLKTDDASDGFAKEELEHFRAFTNAVYREYRGSAGMTERNMLFKIKELWVYWSRNFSEPEKILRPIQKATTGPEYEAAVNMAFREYRG